MRVRLPRRACPACSDNYAGVVDADCPLCLGDGFLILGREALAVELPATVARAVSIYLGDHPRYQGAESKLAVLAEAAASLLGAGIITRADGDWEPTAPLVEPTRRAATDLARRADEIHIDAPQPQPGWSSFVDELAERRARKERERNL